jgi:8-oxo-dGTP pyrophosphatase MutT (NUDIX family)
MYAARTIYGQKFTASDLKIGDVLEKEWVANVDYDALVHDCWKHKEQLAKDEGVRIWDGMYYRVENLAEIEESGKLKFKLGTVPYRYIATAVDLKDAYVANKFVPLCHLSTAAMIRTSDGVYVFGKRSRNGILDVIGGGAQQDEIEIKEGMDLERNLRKEILEETGIDDSHIELIEGMGIVHSMTSNIILISHVQLTISQKETSDVFKHRLEDEMSDLVFVPETEIKDFLRNMPSYRPLIVDFL